MCRGVEGAFTAKPRTRLVPPARSAAALSMQSPPASADATMMALRNTHRTRTRGAPAGCDLPIASTGSRLRSTGRKLVADAGLLLPATLAQHLGLKGLVEEHLDLGKKAGAPNGGDKLRTLGHLHCCPGS